MYPLHITSRWYPSTVPWVVTSNEAQLRAFHPDAPRIHYHTDETTGEQFDLDGLYIRIEHLQVNSIKITTRRFVTHPESEWNPVIEETRYYPAFSNYEDKTFVLNFKNPTIRAHISSVVDLEVLNSLSEGPSKGANFFTDQKLLMKIFEIASVHFKKK